jgi:hypothetical protein
VALPCARIASRGNTAGGDSSALDQGVFVDGLSRILGFSRQMPSRSVKERRADWRAIMIACNFC